MRALSLFLICTTLLLTYLSSEASDKSTKTLKHAYNDAFKMGCSVNSSIVRGRDSVSLEIVKAQFNSITPENDMKAETINPKPDVWNFAPADAFVKFGESNNMFIVGHTLVWHANQNAKYLNSLLAPTVIPGQGGPTWEEIAKQDFETDNASNYQYNNNAVVSFTAAGQGAAGTGRGSAAPQDPTGQSHKTTR